MSKYRGKVIKLARKSDNDREKYRAYIVGNSPSERSQDIDNLLETISELWRSKSVKDWDVSDAKIMLKKIMSLATFPENFRVLIEINYVDKVYRDIYYHHYASRHFSQPRNCIRLFFFTGGNPGGVAGNTSGDSGINLVFDQQYFPLDSSDNSRNSDKCFGVCVLQPNGVIGRSYWNPRFLLQTGNYVRTSTFSVSILGQRQEIPAFPYMMQDQEATTCAEVTVLNLVDYYSNSYSEYNSALLSDIERVEAQHSAERIFPSRGMSYADVSRSLAQIGLAPIVYASRSSRLANMLMQRYLYYYVESGIPFGIAVESSERGIMHSMICIGHGPKRTNWEQYSVVNYLSKDNYGGTQPAQLQQCWIANSADAYDSFVVMDDNKTPYQTVKLSVSSPDQWTYPYGNQQVNYAVDYLCVPLYKRVFLSADGAEELFTSVLTSRMGFSAIMSQLNRIQGKYDIGKYKKIGSKQENPLIIRIFLASSRTFLAQRINMFRAIQTGMMDNHFEAVYQNLYCPRFVWVCELYSKGSYNAQCPRAIGEIVADATARQTGNTDSLDGVVLIHYPHYITYRGTESNWRAFNINGVLLEKWCPFDQFQGNLSKIDNSP